MRSPSEAAILRKYHDLFAALEGYDRTRQLPSDRVRVDLTLSRRVVEQLRQLREKTGTAVSRIVEDAVAAFLERGERGSERDRPRSRK